MADVADPLTQRTDYALYVVTASDRPGRPEGCLAGFVTQCSIEPVRFLVCVSRANRTFEVVRNAPGLALHLLGRDQHQMASLFGEKTGDDVDKFADLRWAPGSTGAPILVECSAWIEGPIDGRDDAGDHQALLVTPSAGGAGPCAGSLTFQHARDLRAGHQPAGRGPSTGGAARSGLRREDLPELAQAGREQPRDVHLADPDLCRDL